MCIRDRTKGEAYVWKSPLADLEEDEFEELDLSSLIKTPEIHVDWEASNKMCIRDRRCAAIQPRMYTLYADRPFCDARKRRLS